MRCYGYERVSTAEQNVARQRAALLDAGVHEDCIFTDYRSGKDFDRPQYAKMIKCLEKGDVLYIKSIDRLGRNYAEILEQWRILTKEMHVDVCVLDMPLLDTRNKKDLTGTLIADIVLQLLSYVAESERKNIRQRQAEGIAAAKARGKTWGRARFEPDECFIEALNEWRSGKITCAKAAGRCGMSKGAFRYHVRNEEKARAETSPAL